MERVKSIDISKGISIILMTLSHILVVKKHPEIADLNNTYFMIFKMPLFIIISGLLYNNKKSLKTFVLSKADSLLKPSASAITLFVCILLFMRLYTNNGINLREILAQSILLIFPLWFIFSLFASLVIFRFIFYISENRSVVLRFVAISAIILTLSLANICSLKYYLVNLSSLIFFVIYLTVGYLAKITGVLKYLISRSMLFVSSALFLTFVIVTQFASVNISLTNNIVEPFFLAMSYSLIGSVLVLNLANIIVKIAWLSKFFVLCGQSSFFILSFHIALGNFLLPMIFPAYNDNYVFDLMIFILTIAGCIAIQAIIRRIELTRYLFFPHMK